MYIYIYPVSPGKLDPSHYILKDAHDPHPHDGINQGSWFSKHNCPIDSLVAGNYPYPTTGSLVPGDYPHPTTDTLVPGDYPHPTTDTLVVGDYPHPTTGSHQVVLIINAKSVAEVPEDLGTIFLELEMTGQIFSEMQVFKVRKKNHSTLTETWLFIKYYFINNRYNHHATA